MQDMKNRRHDKQGGTMILSKTMLASLLAALPLASLSVHAEDAAAVKSEPLRILTYNIYGDWRAPKWGVPPRAAGVERAIVKAKPDVVPAGGDAAGDETRQAGAGSVQPHAAAVPKGQAVAAGLRLRHLPHRAERNFQGRDMGGA